MVFNDVGGGSFELLVDAKTRYDAEITTFAPQITPCYDKCAEVTAAIAAAPPHAVPIATAVCDAIEIYNIDPSAKDASDNTILPILAEHHGNLAAIELAHIDADNLKTGGGRIILAAPAIGINAAGTSAFDQTGLQAEAAAIDIAANAYIVAVEASANATGVANSAAILKTELDKLASIVDINTLDNIINAINIFKSYDVTSISTTHVGVLLLDTLSANITAYIAAAKTEIDRIVTTYKGQLRIYNATAGSADIITAINTYIDEVITGDTAKVGLSLTNAAFLAKLDALDAAIKANEQNAIFYALISRVANPEHIHQLVTDIATAKAAMDAYDFAALIPAYETTLNELNDAIYECYNIFETVASAAAVSPGKALHQAIYNAAPPATGYYHAITEANRILNGIGATGGANPYTATFTEKDTITAAANLALIDVHNTHPRTIEAIAAAGVNDDITLIKVDNTHYFGYKTATPNTYIISYQIRQLINAQLTLPGLLGTIDDALSNTFTINDVMNNAFTIGANLQDIKNILESHVITIYDVAAVAVLYIGNTGLDEYIFWDDAAHEYLNYAINSSQMFNLEVTDAATDITKKIRFVDTAAKIHVLGGLDHYAPSAIISMAHSAVGAQELTPYKVFTHKGADGVYEIDNVLYASFNSAAAAPTIRIPPIITDTGASPIDTNRIKNITYGINFLNNLKRMAVHNYYHSVNNLTIDQFAHNFEIHDIDLADGMLKDNVGHNINFTGTDRNIYQILFYQPLLDFDDDAAAIYALSETEFGAVGNLNHNYRIHIGDLAVEPSYFGFYDVQNGRAQTHHHKIKMMNTLHAKSIGGGQIDTNQHNIIYTFEPFHEYVAGADATVAGFNAQMELFSGYILKKALNEEKVPLLFYDNIAPARRSIHKFITSSDAVDNVTTPIELYALCCSEYIDIANRAANINEQKIFILETPGALLTSVGGGPAPTHVKKYEHGTNNAFGNNGRSYYLYSNNRAGAIKHTMTTNTLAKLQTHSVAQAAAAVAITDPLTKFLENIDCTAGNLITVDAVGGTAQFLNAIQFRYDISAANDIKPNVDDANKIRAKSVDITRVVVNHYDTMIDNCYHVANLANVAYINATITSDNKIAFCQLDHDRGIIYRNSSIIVGGASSFENNKLFNIPFIHEDNTPPTYPNDVNSIDGTITLKHQHNIAGTYTHTINQYLGCGCIGRYNKVGGLNWHTTGGIVHYDAAHNIKIFDDNANTRNFIDGANAAAAANFAIYNVSLMNTILDNNRPEQKVIFYTSAATAAAYPAIDAGNCNAIIPLQSDKDNTPFEDTEFHYYFGGYHNNKYYLSENIGTYMIADRAATAVDAGPFANLKNLRIDHLIKKYKTPNSPLLFKEYGAVIDIADVKKIIKQYMVCEYLPAAANQLFEHDTVGDIDAAATINAIPTASGADKLLSDMRIPVPRIEPYHKIGKYEHVPYNDTIPKPRAITHELRIDNYMGGNLSFFGVYEHALANMTVDATDINSRIFRYSDNIEYNRIIKAAFMMHRPYQIYVPPGRDLVPLHPDPLKYVWISGELSINLDGLSPFSAFNALNTLSTVSSPALPLTDVILYTTATEVLESDEARLRVAPSVKEPEPVKEIEPELVQYAADIHVQKQKVLKEWIEKLNMDSGKSHLVDTDGKTIPNDSNSRHNHPGATQVATIQIKEVEIVKSERDYKKIRDNYNKEVTLAKKQGRPIPKAKIYIIPSSKDWLRHQKNKKTYSLIDKNGNLDLSNIPNGKYIYNGAVIEF